MEEESIQPDNNPDPDQHDRYPMTRWSLVEAAGKGNREALNALFDAYWFPVYGAFFDKVRNHHDAEDLTQRLFSDFYRRDDLKSMAPENGRFRSFLKASVKHMHCNHVDERTTIKRGGDIPVFSIDEEKASEWLSQESSKFSDPSAIFDRRLIHTLLENAKTNLRHLMTEQGKSDVFHAVEDFLLPQAREQKTDEIARRLNKKPGAARVTAFRVRELYRQQIRLGIQNIVENSEEADEEMKYFSELIGIDLTSPIPR